MQTGHPGLLYNLVEFLAQRYAEEFALRKIAEQIGQIMLGLIKAVVLFLRIPISNSTTGFKKASSC